MEEEPLEIVNEPVKTEVEDVALEDEEDPNPLDQMAMMSPPSQDPLASNDNANVGNDSPFMKKIDAGVQEEIDRIMKQVS